MKEKLYFKDEDSEICHTQEYFEDCMREDNIGEMIVFEALPEREPGIFWCKEYLFCGDGTQEYCGKQCDEYEPRNGVSGCCKFHTTKFYTWGDKVIFTL